MTDQTDLTPFERAMLMKLRLNKEWRDRMTQVDILVKGDPVIYMRDGTPMPGHIAEIYEDEMHVKLFNGQVIPFVRHDHGDTGIMWQPMFSYEPGVHVLEPSDGAAVPIPEDVPPVRTPAMDWFAELHPGLTDEELEKLAQVS